MLEQLSVKRSMPPADRGMLPQGCQRSPGQVITPPHALLVQLQRQAINQECPVERSAQLFGAPPCCGRAAFQQTKLQAGTARVRYVLIVECVRQLACGCLLVC